MTATRRIGPVLLLLAAAIALTAGYGARPEDGMSGAGADNPPVAVGPQATETLKPQAEETGETMKRISEPGQFKAFLAKQNIPNGDIYLQDGLVHVNVVGLNGEIEARFAEAFAEDTYVLHDVVYSIEQLRDIQQKIIDEDLHSELNLYATGVDVIGNKVMIEVPEESAEAATARLEQRFGPDMLQLNVQELGPPAVVGKIVEVDAARKSILILEPDEETPTYWFTILEKSRLLDAAGEEITFADLAVSQRVKLWIAGGVNTSLPAQAGARRLELEPAE